jgi:hypothetical protein
MKRYKEFKPTAFDRHIELEDRNDWFVLCGRNRDSEPLYESNFRVACDSLGLDEGDTENAEVAHFTHWANGWFEIILVRPNSKEEELAKEMHERLEEDGVLDEDDYLMLRMERSEFDDDDETESQED